VTGFFRFPHTAHLAWLGRGAPRDDKVLSAVEAADLLRSDVVLEEKVDGANLGFSLDAAGSMQLQNRGQYLRAPYSGQFARLPSWLALHQASIADVLQAHAGSGLMLFGEWCAARHSLDYARLPDWFLLFDVVESRHGRFWSSARRNVLAGRLGLATTPRVGLGRYELEQLKALVVRQGSRFRDGPLEGVVIRREDPDWCLQRAKLVRADFTQTITEHWRERPIEWNRLEGVASR
jgi:ATP-dependent RNA circularization protein (DNA/RNA ligase family)